MTDIILMCIINLGLSLYVLYMQRTIKKYRIALHGAMMMVEDVAEGLGAALNQL